MNEELRKTKNERFRLAYTSDLSWTKGIWKFGLRSFLQMKLEIICSEEVQKTMEEIRQVCSTGVPSNRKNPWWFWLACKVEKILRRKPHKTLQTKSPENRF